MNVALRVYEQLTDAGEDKVRARAIADGFEQLEERYAPLKDTATQGHLRETELRLLKEIREVELKLGNEIREVELKLGNEIREVELKLTKEIEGVRLEIREVELKLSREIEGVRLDVKSLEAQGEKNRADLVRWVVAVGTLQTTLVLGVLMKIAHLI
jgi:SMC interacting uncharacterized protein involved in chromosome segregation